MSLLCTSRRVSTERKHSNLSNCSGGSVPSSMETVPTNEEFDFGSDEEDGPPVWGRLYPIGTSFSSVDLTREEYTFGRGELCDYQFNSPAQKKHPCFQAYSKVHFKLSRQSTTTGTHVFLQDMSSNGTFINGEKVGKNNKQVLNTNDEISMAMTKNRAFMYMDPNANDDKNLPAELKEKYTLSKTLGRGACGEVRLAFAKGTCTKYAVKIIEKKTFTVSNKNALNTPKQIMAEVKILKSLRHPCIIQIEDVIDTPDVIYIVLELVEGGELFDRVVSVSQFEEPIAKLLFYQMAVAVKYLHDQGITHRDLKPENILLSSDENETLVKVTDFGLSKFVDSGTMLKTFCGTPNYLAPEILVSAGIGAYTKAIDCWSLGVILYICLVGYPPFSDERKEMELNKQILGGHYDFPKEYWNGISDDAIDLVKKLMTVDPKERISLADTLSHPWMKDDDMKMKAHKIMYPDSDGMMPPAGLPKKRKVDSPDSSTNKKKA